MALLLSSTHYAGLCLSFSTGFGGNQDPESSFRAGFYLCNRPAAETQPLLLMREKQTTGVKSFHGISGFCLERESGLVLTPWKLSPHSSEEQREN